MSRTQWFLSGIAMLGWLSPAAAADIQFSRDVRPILSDKCYACHGPDKEHREAGLHFDTKAGAFVDLGGYAAIQAGHAGESELIRRINADDDTAMPPPEHAKQLTDREKLILFEWIAQGADWQDHWSYVPPQRPTPPVTRDRDWPLNFVDAFVLDKLESLGIAPSPTADRRTLIRRLSFDLTGLPPDSQDVADFLADESAFAYETVVDRLLKSPHFGERMAIFWLDLVRYADTVGYHGDQDMSVSPYRDYVIQAFNSNLPFDQFTREQLAGDLLEEPTREQLVASGYNRIGMMSAEGGVQPEEYLAKYAADRVRTASVVWLGSTLGCAECHDHKFDPFTSRDFYAFAAFFADIKERGLYSGPDNAERWGPIVEVTDLELDEQLPELDARIAELEDRLNTPTDSLARAQAAWQNQIAEQLSGWHVLTPTNANALHGTKLTIRDDASLLASGPNPDRNIYTLTFRNYPDELTSITGLRLEVLPDESLPGQGPGRAGNGNFVISELRLSVENDRGEARPVELRNATATIEQSDSDNKNPYQGWKAAAVIDQDESSSNWGWAVLPDAGKRNALQVELAEPLTGTLPQIEITIEQNHSNPKHTLGRFRLSATAQVQPPPADRALLIPDDVRQALLSDAESRTEHSEQQIASYYRTIAPELEESRQALAGLQQKRKQLKASLTRTSLITVAIEPREMRVLKRGNWMDKTGEIVEPSVPHFLKQLACECRATRLDLANWLVSQDNPLTARVFVNRIWKLLFGTGLSKQLDDIGSQGEPPSHPELLDALAVEFMESGWNTKQLIKRLVMSRTYRQSSMARQDLQTKDPYNRLLARQSRFRLEAEAIRDNALFISGLLIPEIGGRSVKPYQPEGLYRHLNFPTRTYRADSGANQYRRGVYTHWQRQFLHPAMQAFDAPAREECTAERPRSNTPLAALVLLNDPSYVEAARAFATRAITEVDASSADRLDWMFLRALSRKPSDEERKILTALATSQCEAYSLDPTAAQEFISIGQSKPPADIPAEVLAAWTAVARAVFNMHETITRN